MNAAIAMCGSVVGRLAHHALTRGQATAFHVIRQDLENEISYETLLRQAAGYAKFLAEGGIRPGDLLFLCLKHGVDVYAAYLGAMFVGAIPSFLAFPTPKQDPALYWQMHRILFEQMGGKAVLTYPENQADLAAALPAGTGILIVPPAIPVDTSELPQIIERYAEPQMTATALVQFSSGTTGIRKGVRLSHAQIALQVSSLAVDIHAREGMRICSWLPLYHDMGLMSAFLIPIHFGGTVISLDPFEWVARPQMLFEAMDRFRCTHAWLPNFAFNHLVRTKVGGETYRLDHVEALINCSEPCKRASFDLFEASFAEHGIRAEQLQASYGMAETVFAVTQSQLGAVPRTLWLDRQAVAENRLVRAEAEAADAMALLSNGPPIAGIEVRIEGGGIGEIQVRGAFLFDGYLNAPEATASAFDGDWYRTGDTGCVVDGEVYIVGRLKEIIIHHGRNYYAHDIEAAANGIAGIKAGRCVALGVWNEGVGSEEVALVAEREPMPGLTDAQIRNALKQAVVRQFNLAVSIVHLVELGWLVKTTSGKISRKENLAKLLRERHRHDA